MTTTVDAPTNVEDKAEPFAPVETSAISARLTTLLVIGFLIGILVVELGVRALGPRFGDPVLWHTDAAATKIDILEQTGGPITVLVGTSQTAQGLDPSRFDSETVNVALSSGVPELHAQWLKEVTSRATVDRVVWGVNPLVDFTNATDLDVVSKYEQAPATAQGTTAALLRWTGQRSALVRQRSNWAANGWSRLAIGDQSQPLGRVDSLGYGPFFTTDASDREANRWRETLSTIDFGETQVTAFRTAVSDLRGQDIEIVIVEVPMPEHTIALLPGGRPRYLELRAQMVAVMDELGLAFLPYDDSWEANENFKDYSHLNEVNAARFTDDLVRRLAG